MKLDRPFTPDELLMHTFIERDGRFCISVEGDYLFRFTPENMMERIKAPEGKNFNTVSEDEMNEIIENTELIETLEL